MVIGAHISVIGKDKAGPLSRLSPLLLGIGIIRIAGYNSFGTDRYDPVPVEVVNSAKILLDTPGLAGKGTVPHRGLPLAAERRYPVRGTGHSMAKKGNKQRA